MSALPGLETVGVAAWRDHALEVDARMSGEDEGEDAERNAVLDQIMDLYARVRSVHARAGLAPVRVRA